MRGSKHSGRPGLASKRASMTLLALSALVGCGRSPAPSAAHALDAIAPRPQPDASTSTFTESPPLDATADDASVDAWDDAAPPESVRVHPVLESLRNELLRNATPDARYTLERVNISNTDRGAGRAIYYALWDYTLRTLLPAALYRPSDWRWPRTRITDDATLLSSASMYTDDAFTLDRAPSFDMRCLSETCPREAERRAECNTRPLDFVRGWMDATVTSLRARPASRGGPLDGGVTDGGLTEGGALTDGDASASAEPERSDEDYCAESMTMITELSILTEVRTDCRSTQAASVAMLHAIATTARRRLRPAGTPVPFRDASAAVDP